MPGPLPLASRMASASWLTTGTPSTMTGAMVTAPSESSSASVLMIGKAPVR